MTLETALSLFDSIAERGTVTENERGDLEEATLVIGGALAQKGNRQLLVAVFLALAESVAREGTAFPAMEKSMALCRRRLGK